MSKKLSLIIIVVLLIVSSVFVVLYVRSQAQVKSLQAKIGQIDNSSEVKTFMVTFIETVLQNDGEVSFENRLKLENAVRATNDKELLALWDRFVGSKDKDEAERNFEALMVGLARKI